MNDNFSALPVFVAVLETGSFSGAASKINITKSAVSKRISVLEDNMGVRLFNRTTRKLTLTEAGERFSDYARNAVLLAEQGLAAVTQFQGKPKGTLKINAPMTFSRLHIVPFINEFLAMYPDIKVILSMDDNLVEMVEGGFDVSIRIGELQDSSLIAKKLVDCLSVVCASPEYLAKHGEPISPDALIEHNCVYYSLFQAGVEWSFYHEEKIPEKRFPDEVKTLSSTKSDSTKASFTRALSKKIKVQPAGNFVVNNSDAILAVLLQGLGICQMPTFIVQEYIKKGDLVTILDNYKLPVHAVYAVYPQRKHLPEKVKVFIEYLDKKLGGGSGYWDNYNVKPESVEIVPE